MAADFPGPITAALPIQPAGADRRAQGRQNPESEQPKAQPPAGRQRRSRPQDTASVLVVKDDDAHLIDEYG